MGKAQKLKQLRKLEQEEERVLTEKNKKKKLIITFLVLILLAVLAVATFYFVKYMKEKDIRRVVVETDKGNIKLELYSKAAPKTVENFIKLAKDGFYNGTKFHRVVKDFIIQGGDPLSKDDDPNNDGTGDPGYTFEDEINPIALNLTLEETKQLEQSGYKFRTDLESIPHTTGVISMANSGPNTNGSQFFIIIGPDQPQLNGRHTAFGRVIEGLEVAQSIEQGDIIKEIKIIK